MNPGRRTDEGGNVTGRDRSRTKPDKNDRDGGSRFFVGCVERTGRHAGAFHAPYRERGSGRCGSELVERGLLLGIDLEDLVEPGDAEDFEQLGVDAAELEL